VLTNLRVRGFKNLLDVSVRFGPFTCIAGLNAAGKSNLFDAVSFLHWLTQKPIMEAVQQVRETKGRAPEPADLFTRFEGYTVPEMRFTAELVVNRNVEDDFGVKAKAAISTLKYEVAFRLSKDDPNILELADESLSPIPIGDASQTIGFEHKRDFRESIVSGRRPKNLISAAGDWPKRMITVHQEGHGGRKLLAPKSSRTVLGGMANSDFPTVLAAHKEMASWHTLLLEPSAMRTPSLYRDARYVDTRGANLPNAIDRLIKQEKKPGQVCAELANRLSRLVDEVKALRVIDDKRFETKTLEVLGREGVYHAARSLSDGTLRFLVLAALELDPEVRGVVCLEEPENGIHPERIETMVQLLKDIAVDANFPVGLDNPLRQVIINTHSPLVVRNVSVDDLIYIEEEQVVRDESKGRVASIFIPPQSWRAKFASERARLAPGRILTYLGKGKPSEQEQLWFEWMNQEPSTKRP
jgi:predicted ATPase